MSPIDTTACNAKPSKEAIVELQRAPKVFEHEMEILCQDSVTELEEINVGTMDDPHIISIAKNIPPIARSVMVMLLYEYRDVFA